MSHVRRLISVSLFWLGLSMLADGVNTLILPAVLFNLVSETTRATTLGLLTFAGLLVAMFVQPVAGMASDLLRPRYGRRGLLALGAVLSVAALAVFGSARSLALVIFGYLFLQAAGSVAQAAQQGFLPDLIPARLRGAASGMKSLADVGGAMLGFVLLGQALGRNQAGLALWIIAAVLLALLALTVLLVREVPLPSWTVIPVTGFKPGPWMLNAFRLSTVRQRSFLWLVAARFLFLLGVYGVGRFMLFFVAERLALDPANAAAQSGNLLAGLALVTVLASLPAGWAADRVGRLPVMVVGALLSAAGVLLLILARSAADILLFGALMSVGSAAFSTANWALTADLVPTSEAGRFMGLANFGTAGAAAVAGLFGPLIDAANAFLPGAGYPAIFFGAALAFLSSLLALRFVRARPAPVGVSGQA